MLKRNRILFSRDYFRFKIKLLSVIAFILTVTSILIYLTFIQKLFSGIFTFIAAGLIVAAIICSVNSLHFLIFKILSGRNVGLYTLNKRGDFL